MQRIGKFTHRIYSEEDYNFSVIHECTIVLPDSCETEKDLQEILEIPTLQCEDCYGCPNAKEALGREGKKV